MLSQNVCHFYQLESVDGQMLCLPIVRIGDAGYRSPYFSHAKRALYHLSYIPSVIDSKMDYYKLKNINFKVRHRNLIDGLIRESNPGPLAP